MSHYRRRAGLCAPLFLAVSLRVMMGMALLQFALPIHAQAPAPLPSVSTPSTNLILLPDRGNVTILKLDDQLRVGKPIVDGQALTFTSSDSIDGVVERDMHLKMCMRHCEKACAYARNTLNTEKYAHNR